MSFESPILLYDGDCGFCARSVQFVLTHESSKRPATLRFAPLQGSVGAEVRARHPETSEIDSVVWYEPADSGRSRARTRGDAVLSVWGYLGGPWRVLAALGRVVPRTLRDAVYDAIARRRFAMVARACLLPSAEQRHRFVGLT